MALLSVPGIALCLGICVVGVVLLLIADRSGRRALEWLGKPAAALSFIAAGWLWGAADSVYGLWILAGLVLGAVGDVCLIPKGQGKAFLAGMIAFLVGHLAFAIAFLSLDLAPFWLGLSAVAMVAVGGFVLRWLLPNTPQKFKIPVLAYNLVIGAMVILACGATGAGATPLIAVGAIVFAVSDIFVARNRFVSPGFENRLIGIPLYFAAQLMIAATVALI